MVDGEEEGDVGQRGEERERANRGVGGRVKEEKEKGSRAILLKCPSLSLFFCSKVINNWCR